ncbi:hypothetical protein GCM10023223_18990 [Stackebrandtia albiflava]
MPYRSARCSATASRNERTPTAGAYWLLPAAISRCARASIAAGPPPSGNPCPRFTAPVRTANAAILEKIDTPNSGRIGGTAGVGPLRASAG